MYVQIVENRWKDGRSKQRVIAPLGRLDRLREYGQLESLLGSEARFCESVLLLAAHRRGETTEMRTRAIGPAVVFERVWRQTGCKKVIERLLQGRKFQFPVERALFLTVLHRLFDPGSDRAAEKWKNDCQVEGVTSLSRLFNTIGPQDGEQNITAQVALGIDHVDYVTMPAPKPTLILTGTYDFFDIDGSWDTFREAKRVYGILGFGERVDLFEYPDKHGFSQPRREAALRWMRRWLQGIDDAPTEPELTLQSDEALQVTESGQVVTDFDGRTVWDLSLDRAKELAADREAFLRHTAHTQWWKLGV